MKLWIILLALIGLLLAACGGADSATSGDPNRVQLTLAAYTAPREAYAEILPLFAAQWKNTTGQTIIFEESYQGSGTQSRAVIEGFEADIVALALDSDVQRIADAGLITDDWRSAPHSGIVSNSVVALAVRQDNPKHIRDWADLIQPDLEILTPNPRTSGGAQWNILAVYGAALRGQVAGVAANDPAAAQEFLRQLLGNVLVMDKGARESITNFEQGVGDVAITYENEVLVAQQSGQRYELVLPASTILIENPAALVDSYVDKHGTRTVAEAFIQFLHTKPAQEAFAHHGLRAVDADVLSASTYPAIKDLFTIAQFGGWSRATPDIFGADGIYTRLSAQVTP